jgi:hypothetical protein
VLGGDVTAGNTVMPINYPNWTLFETQVDQGAAMLNTAIESAALGRRRFPNSLMASLSACPGGVFQNRRKAVDPGAVGKPHQRSCRSSSSFIPRRNASINRAHRRSSRVHRNL